jgi:hypothetical protein
VVFAGIVAVTAVRPSCNFSREIVNRITAPLMCKSDGTALDPLKRDILAAVVEPVEHVESGCNLHHLKRFAYRRGM